MKGVGRDEGESLRGGDSTCKGPVVGVRDRKKGSSAAAPEPKQIGVDSGSCYVGGHGGSLACLYLSLLT